MPFVRFQDLFEKGFERFRNGYRALLASCFEHRRPFMIFFLAFCVGSWLLTVTLGQNFFPSVDTGQFLLHLRAHTGTRIEETERLAAQDTEVDAVYRSEVPEPLGEAAGPDENLGAPHSLVGIWHLRDVTLGAG